jgi:hypothetical protein
LVYNKFCIHSSIRPTLLWPSCYLRRRLGGWWIRHSQGRSRERPKLTWELYYNGPRRVTRSMEGIELAGKTVQWSDLEVTILRTKGHFWPASKEEFRIMGLLLLQRRRRRHHHHHHHMWQKIRCYGQKESRSRCCTSFCILYAWMRLGQYMV